jgi:hypothetical protein
MRRGLDLKSKKQGRYNADFWKKRVNTLQKNSLRHYFWDLYFDKKCVISGNSISKI